MLEAMMMGGKKNPVPALVLAQWGRPVSVYAQQPLFDALSVANPSNPIQHSWAGGPLFTMPAAIGGSQSGTPRVSCSRSGRYIMVSGWGTSARGALYDTVLKTKLADSNFTRPNNGTLYPIGFMGERFLIYESTGHIHLTNEGGLTIGQTFNVSSYGIFNSAVDSLASIGAVTDKIIFPLSASFGVFDLSGSDVVFSEIPAAGNSRRGAIFVNDDEFIVQLFYTSGANSIINVVNAASPHEQTHPATLYNGAQAVYLARADNRVSIVTRDSSGSQKYMRTYNITPSGGLGSVPFSWGPTTSVNSFSTNTVGDFVDPSGRWFLVTSSQIDLNSSQIWDASQNRSRAFSRDDYDYEQSSHFQGAFFTLEG